MRAGSPVPVLEMSLTPPQAVGAVVTGMASVASGDHMEYFSCFELSDGLRRTTTVCLSTFLILELFVTSLAQILSIITICETAKWKVGESGS